MKEGGLVVELVRFGEIGEISHDEERKEGGGGRGGEGSTRKIGRR